MASGGVWTLTGNDRLMEEVHILREVKETLPFYLVLGVLIIYGFINAAQSFSPRLVDDAPLVKELRPSVLGALYFLGKAVSVLGVGIVVSRADSVYLLPVTVTLICIALSYLYIVSAECADRQFFPSAMANRLVGFTTAVPVLGTSNSSTLSRVLLGAVAVVASFFCIHTWGAWALFKYWLLPLAFMQLTVRVLHSRRVQPAFLRLLPSSGAAEERLLRRCRFPVYRYDEALRCLRVEACGNESADGGAPQAPPTTLEKLCMYAPTTILTRAIFRWRRRDLLLVAGVAAGGLVAYYERPSRVPLSAVLALSALLVGCVLRGNGTPPTRTPRAPGSGKRKRRGDTGPLRVILYGKYLDLTSWAKHHPGGRKPLIMFQDRDATEIFEAYHSPAAARMLSARLKACKEEVPAEAEAVPERTATLRRAYKDLVDRARARGLFRANPLHEAVKAAAVLGFYFVGAYLLKFSPYTWTGMLMFCLGVQQLGWLAHDYSHHSVLRSPVLNDACATFLGYLQTYDSMWWKARHNTHHVCTNEEGKDPDIETSPLFTYLHSQRTVKAGLNWLQRRQHIYFVPGLCLLHVYWSLESLFFVLARLRTMKHRLVFWIASNAFYAWLFYGHGVPFFLLFAALKGFGTGVVVFATHYAEDRLPLDHTYSLVEQTALTSRNISGNWLIHQFCGAISYQIEHHLCPMMPRSRLSEFQPMVQEFFKQHNLVYRNSSIVGCTLRNIQQLKVT
eukprot:CAMPEP_0119137974 /NCGR_PEP_ID=MMETSP1310-20130426/24782_1 /TAXON_ID=464262 /ORGANISM="Genus nov. species nov., Strain RCC2339" /LENGTH=732 /DNA_ID=CAMNT_0007129119 /DNA_START=123 /DNA_END=2321 /DNA_ORIENTATION=+